MEAGLEHLGVGNLRDSELLLVVAEAKAKSLLTAHRTIALARKLGIRRVELVGNRAHDSDRQALEAFAAQHQVAGGNDLGSGVRQKSSIRVVAVPADIEGADSFDAGLGAPRLIARTAGNLGHGGGVAVYDLRVPVGMTAPVSLSVPAVIRQLLGPGRVPPSAGSLPQTDAYDWQTGTWRVLSNNGASRPLTPGEVAGGVVRVRISPTSEKTPVGELVATDQAAP